MKKNIVLAVTAILLSLLAYALLGWPFWITLIIIFTGAVITIMQSQTHVWAKPITIILTIAITIAAGQMWLKSSSPKINASVDRRSTAAEQGVANAFDKSSLKSELESGIFAKIKTPTTAYTASAPYAPLHKFTIGDMVLVLDTQGVKADQNGEGGTHVMWANPDGDFVAGNKGYIPTRAIDWDWQKGSSKKDSDDTTAIDVTPSVKKTVVQQTITVQVAKPAPIDPLPISLLNKNLEMKYVAGNGVPQYFKVNSIVYGVANDIEINCAFQMKFVGSSVGNNTYRGTWSQPGVNGSEFEISFSDDSHASGDIHVSEGWRALTLYPI